MVAGDAAIRLEAVTKVFPGSLAEHETLAIDGVDVDLTILSMGNPHAVQVVAGNVATPEGVAALVGAGADIVRGGTGAKDTATGDVAGRIA